MAASGLLQKLRLSSLRSQLILGITFIIIVSISLFVVDMLSRQKDFLLKLNHDRGVSLSLNLSNIAASHVVAYELDGLQNLITTYKKMPGLEYAMVTSYDGIVLAHTNENYLGMRASDNVSTKLKPLNETQVLVENNYVFDVASPIVNHNEIVGWARIGLSQTYLTSNLSEVKKRGILYILIGLIVGTIFAILVANRLAKGLQSLIATAKKIKAGNRDVRAEPARSFEVTELGTAFNQMLDEISANEKLLSKVLENMPVGVFILDAQGKVLSLNPAAQQIWEGAKYVGMGEYNVYKGWFPNGKEIESHEWGAAVALNENRAVLNQEAEIEGFDGNRKTILNSCIPMHDANEKIVGVISINVDITQRKNIEDKLRESQEQLTLFIEHSPASLAMFDTEMRYIATSRRWMNDYNLGNKNVIGKTHYEIFPEIGQEWKDIHQRCLKGAIERREEDSFARIDGTKDWLRWEIRPWHKSTGEIGGIIMFTEVITERKNAEIKLEQSEEKNRALIENISDTIILLNEKAEVTYQSPAFVHTAGFSMEELEGKTVFDYIHPEDVESAEKLYKEALNEPGVPMPTQYRVKHRQGHYIWVEGTVMNLLNNESVKAIIINYRDVSERKKFEEQQLLITSIVNSSDDAIFSNDLNGIVTSWNKGAERILGYSSGEIIGKPVLTFFPEDIRHEEQNFIENIRKGISIEHFETYRIKKGGQVIPVSITVSPIKDILGNIVGASKILRDITEQKRSEEELVEMNKKLRQLSAHVESAQEEERTRIAREIHDELGQQLTGLKMDAFIVAKNIEADKTKATDKVNEMVKLIDFAIKTVRRISSDLRPGILDDLGLMAAIEWQGMEFEKRTGVKLVFDSDLPDLNPERNLSTNVFRVYQEILTNIMRHAKATLVETKLAVKENNIILEVKDNGQGFNFEEVKNKGSLGLVGMKERVKLFNGELGIDSKKNRGTVINLKVPMINHKN